MTTYYCPQVWIDSSLCLTRVHILVGYMRKETHKLNINLIDLDQLNAMIYWLVQILGKENFSSSLQTILKFPLHHTINIKWNSILSNMFVVISWCIWIQLRLSDISWMIVFFFCFFFFNFVGRNGTLFCQKITNFLSK